MAKADVIVVINPKASTIKPCTLVNNMYIVNKKHDAVTGNDIADPNVISSTASLLAFG